MSVALYPDLNRALVLQDRVQTPDGAGGFTSSWVDQGTLWAQVVLRSGRDARSGQAVVAQASYRITVRGAPVGAPSRPRPDQRFVEGTRVFTILAVAEADPRGRFLTCYAEEEVPT